MRRDPFQPQAPWLPQVIAALTLVASAAVVVTYLDLGDAPSPESRNDPASEGIDSFRPPSLIVSPVATPVDMPRVSLDTMALRRFCFDELGARRKGAHVVVRRLALRALELPAGTWKELAPAASSTLWMPCGRHVDLSSFYDGPLDYGTYWMAVELGNDVSGAFIHIGPGCPASTPETPPRHQIELCAVHSEARAERVRVPDPSLIALPR